MTDNILNSINVGLAVAIMLMAAAHGYTGALVAGVLLCGWALVNLAVNR